MPGVKLLIELEIWLTVTILVTDLAVAYPATGDASEATMEMVPAAPPKVSVFPLIEPTLLLAVVEKVTFPPSVAVALSVIGVAE